jgi:RNA polymerase sigma-70 factor (ECF subfamily)
MAMITTDDVMEPGSSEARGMSMPSGHREADEHFARLVADGLDRAYRLAGLILGDAADAEDVTQDAAVRAWQSAGSLRDPAAFGAWFDRIVVNACRDRVRRYSRVRFVPLDAHGDRPIADPFQALIDHDEALRVIRCLGHDERAVVVLHYWADLPLSELASRLGWPVGTVKTRLHRALETMRREQLAQVSGKVASR